MQLTEFWARFWAGLKVERCEAMRRDRGCMGHHRREMEASESAEEARKSRRTIPTFERKSREKAGAVEAVRKTQTERESRGTERRVR